MALHKSPVRGEFPPEHRQYRHNASSETPLGSIRKSPGNSPGIIKPKTANLVAKMALNTGFRLWPGP